MAMIDLKPIIDNRKVRMGLVIFAVTILIILMAEITLNLWMRASLEAGFMKDNRPDAKLQASISWMGITDLWWGKVGWVKIDAQNCRISDLRYERFQLDNQGFSLNMPRLLTEKCLEITSIQKTRINAVVSAAALQDYFNLYHPGYEIGVKIFPGRLQLAGKVLFLGNKVPVELEGILRNSAAKTIEFRPLGLSIAGHSISGGLLNFIGNQLPVKFSVMENWPLELTGLQLSQGFLSLSLKESR